MIYLYINISSRFVSLEFCWGLFFRKIRKYNQKHISIFCGSKKINRINAAWFHIFFRFRSLSNSLYLILCFLSFYLYCILWVKSSILIFIPREKNITRQQNYLQKKLQSIIIHNDKKKNVC